jgi:hypothetical protein
VVFKGDKGSIDVVLKDGKSRTLDKYFYLDFLPSATSTLGTEDALVFKAPKGYCDGPGCGDSFVAYSAKHNDDFYNLVFYGDTELNQIEQAILSSFKFIE